MTDVNVNFPPTVSPNRVVTAGDVESMVTQVKADVEGQVSVVSAQLADKATKTEVTAASNKVGSLSEKRKKQIRRDGSFKITKFVFPTGFGWQDAPINIFFDGVRYYTDFDVSIFKNTGPNTYWVDPLNGLNTNPGTEAQPFLTIEKAYTVAAAGDTIMLKDGIYFRPNAWVSTALIQKSINIIAVNPGKVTIPFCDNLIYTLTSGNVYQVNRSNVKDVVDFTFHEYGYKYKKVNSIVECQNLVGSWYTDNTVLYVHALSNKSPDSKKVFALLTGIHFKATNDLAPLNLYLEGISIIGGDSGNVRMDRISAANAMSLYNKKCKFLYTTGNDGFADSINADGVDFAFSQDSICAYSNKDGFNYTANNSATTVNPPKFIEVNCKGINNGLPNIIDPNTNNGSTAHNGSKGIRMGCTYYGNMGGNLVDVQAGTQSLNFNPVTYDPKSKTNDVYDTNICAQQAGAEMWVYDAIAFGAANDIYSVTGATMHVFDSEFETKNGGGTLEIVNQM